MDFRQTLVIMTSNLGTDLIADAKDDAARSKIIHTALRGFFRPEFLNRLDDIVVFHPLEPAQIEAIVDLQIALVEERLADRKIHIVLTPPARAFLAREGYDPQFGARPLKRTVQRLVVDPLTVRILAGEVPDGAEVRLELAHDQIELKVPRGAPKGKAAAGATA